MTGRLLLELLIVHSPWNWHLERDNTLSFHLIMKSKESKELRCYNLFCNGIGTTSCSTLMGHLVSDTSRIMQWWVNCTIYAVFVQCFTPQVKITTSVFLQDVTLSYVSLLYYCPCVHFSQYNQISFVTCVINLSLQIE